MCKFCDGYFNGEVVEKIESKPIGIGNFENVWALELWMMVDDENNQPKNPRLNVALSETSTGDDISNCNIPIHYCPFCGRELIKPDKKVES